MKIRRDGGLSSDILVIAPFERWCDDRRQKKTAPVLIGVPYSLPALVLRLVPGSFMSVAQ